jgi:DNA-binding Xre family transcriptional regulator
MAELQLCDAEDDLQRENLFTLLRKAIKAKGYTYGRLADEMQVSELSIKRLFKEKDCKMSRLLEICSIVGLSMADLVSMQQRVKQVPEYLPEHTERELASDQYLFLLFILLVSHVDLNKIQAVYGIDQPQLYLRLRRLEKLGLIELLPEERYRFLVSLPIQWRMDGALQGVIEHINHRYISHCLKNASSPEYTFTTTSRLMTKHSAQKIQSSLEKIREEFDYLTTQDQMFYKPEELGLYKLVFAMGEFPVDVILTENGV